MNAHVERFNRTIQKKFIDYHEDLLVTPTNSIAGLIPWLLWPVQFLLKQNPAVCKIWVA